MSWQDSLKEAINIANEAVKEDEKKNFAEALRLYDRSKGYFFYSIEQLSSVRGSELVVEQIKSKSNLYEKRADKLRLHLTKQELSNG